MILPTAATLIRWLHLLAAMFWVGGMLFLVIVVLPVTRQYLDDTQRVAVSAAIGRRFLAVSWSILALLAGTGLLNALNRGLTLPMLVDSPYGWTLLVKLSLVASVVVITAVHGFWYGRRLDRIAKQLAATPDSPALLAERTRLQRGSIRLSALNLLLSLIIVLLAAHLVAL